MDNIHQHIEKDREIINDPMCSSQSRRHAGEELESLEKYHTRHPESDRVPTPFEIYCDENPDALECRIYED